MITVWRPALSIKSLMNGRTAKSDLDDLATRKIRWDWAKADDWPNGWIGSDFRFARNGGFGFVHRNNKRIYFLVPRGWDQPEWGIAVLDDETRAWLDLGDFEPIPPSWILPEPNIAQT